MTEKRKYDSTVARIAGNILSGLRPYSNDVVNIDSATRFVENHVLFAVHVARAIVAEVERTEPSRDE